MAPRGYNSGDWPSLQEAAAMTAILARDETGEKIKNWFTPDKIFFFVFFGFLLVVILGFIIWCCRRRSRE
jgi:hypothetical protein